MLVSVFRNKRRQSLQIGFVLRRLRQLLIQHKSDPPRVYLHGCQGVFFVKHYWLVSNPTDITRLDDRCKIERYHYIEIEMDKVVDVIKRRH